MGDVVAVASVISTAAVGVAGLVTQAWLARRAQSHQSDLAERQREMELQKEARNTYLALSQWCLQLADHLDRPSERTWMSMHRSRELEAQLAVYARPELRATLDRLDAALVEWEDQRVDKAEDLEAARRRKEDAIGKQDFEVAAAARQHERTILASMGQEPRERLSDLMAMISIE